jgi:hypothetical protein
MFLIGWLIVFLLGADFPPPIGFIWLVLLIIVLDIIQSFYLKNYFLMHIENNKNTKLFFMNALYYLAGGLIIAILTSISNFQSVGLLNTLIWIIVLTLVGVLYGIIFWVFNILLFRLIK